MANELAAAYVSLHVQSAGIRGEVEKAVGAGSKGVGSKAGKGIGGRMAGAMGKALKVGALAAGAAVGVAAGASLVSGFKSAISQEKTEKTLGGLYGSTDKARGMMERLKDVAGKSPIDLAAFSKGAESLAYMGIEGGRAEKILTNVGAAVTAAGGSGQEMGRSTDAMLKMVNAGEVQLDTLNQLSEAGVPIFSGLSKHFGVSIKEVRAMVTEGSVGLEDVLSVTENATGETFKKMKKASSEVAKSFSGQWAIAKDRVVTAIGRGMRPAIEKLAPVIGVAGGAIAGFVENFSDGEGAAGRFRDALGRVGGYLKSGFVAVFERVAPVVTGVFEALSPHVQKFAGAMRDLAPKAMSLASAVGDFLVAAFKAAKPYIETVATIIGGALIGAMKVLPSILSGVMSGFKGVLNFIKPLLPLIAGLTTAWIVYKGVMGAARLATKLWTAVTKIAAGVQKALNAVMRANPIGLLVTAIMILVGVFVLLYKKNETARRIMDAAWKSIKAVIKGVVGWFKNTAWPMMKKVFTAIGDVVAWLVGFIKDHWRLIISIMLGPMGILVALVTKHFGKIKTVIGAVFKWIKNTAWPWVRNAFQWIADKAKWLWGKIKQSFNWWLDKAKAVSGWIKKQFVDRIRNAFNWIVDKAKWWWSNLKRNFNFVLDKVKAVAGWIRKQMVDRIRAAFTAISDKAGWLWKKVKVPFDRMKSGAGKLKDAFVKAKDGIKKAWGKILGHIQGPIKKALRWLNKNFIGKLNTLLGKIPGVSFSIPKINTKGFASGGWTGPGSKMTPAGVVHADEYVVNKKSRGKFERGNPGVLDHINRTGRLPGYAGGGIVALGKRLQGLGYDVSEHPAFGGVVPGAHSANGFHYKGGALDINADPWNSRFNRETPALDSLNRMLKGEGWNTIWRAPNHWDHLHVDIGNGQGGSGGGLFDMVKRFMPDWAKSLASSPAKYVRDKVAGFMGGMKGDKFGIAGKVLPGMVGKAAKGLGNKVSSVFDLSGLVDKFMPGWMSGGDSGGGGGTDRWRGVVGKALSMLGLPGSAMGATLRRMQQESGGDPRAVNNWDSNAARGTPSKGLMQVIDPTFRAYAYPGHNDIWNPLDNILASMRYAMGRYGSLSSAYNRPGGYSDGGQVKPFVADSGVTLAPGLNLLNNKLGKPEPLRRTDMHDGGGDTFNVSFSIDDVDKMHKVGDFIDMLDKSRVSSRRTLRSGMVST